MSLENINTPLCTHLDEANIRRLLPERLPAHVEPVFADETCVLPIARDDTVSSVRTIPDTLFRLQRLASGRVQGSSYQLREPLP